MDNMPYQCYPPNPRRRPSSPPPVTRKPLKDMTPDEVRTWLTATRAALQEQYQRTQGYLDHRAARGIHTPTDDDLERDQLLASDLLLLLDELEQTFQEGQP